MSYLFSCQKAEPSSHQKVQILNKVITENINKQLLKLKELPFDETDALFSVLGRKYRRLTTSQKAITSNDKIVTILGCSSTWKTPELIYGFSKEKDEYEKSSNSKTSNQNSPSQKWQSVFSTTRIENWDSTLCCWIPLVYPSVGFDEEEDKIIEKKSPLLNAALIKNFIKILKIKI